MGGARTMIYEGDRVQPVGWQHGNTGTVLTVYPESGVLVDWDRGAPALEAPDDLVLVDQLRTRLPEFGR